MSGWPNEAVRGHPILCAKTSQNVFGQNLYYTIRNNVVHSQNCFDHMPHLVRLCLMEKCLATKQASAVVYRQLAGWEPVTNATYYYLVKKSKILCQKRQNRSLLNGFVSWNDSLRFSTDSSRDHDLHFFETFFIF